MYKTNKGPTTKSFLIRQAKVVKLEASLSFAQAKQVKTDRRQHLKDKVSAIGKDNRTNRESFKVAHDQTPANNNLVIGPHDHA